MARIGLEVRYSGDGLGAEKFTLIRKIKLFFLWDKSNALGQANHEMTAKIIKKSFPDFEIK